MPRYKRSRSRSMTRRPSKFRRTVTLPNAGPPVANKFIAQRGEVKHKDFTITGSILSGAVSSNEITTLTQGTAADNRIGDKVHVLGVDIQGYVGTTGYLCDTHLCSPTDNHTPVITDFIGTTGGQVANQFVKDWVHIVGCQPASGNSTIRRNFRFKYPLEVTYSGAASSTGLRNKLFVSVVNPTSVTNSSMSMSVRIYYQDN